MKDANLGTLEPGLRPTDAVETATASTATDGAAGKPAWAGWLLVLVLAGQAASYLPMLSADLRFTQFCRDDTEVYLALAHSLAHGRGYTTSLDPSRYAGHLHFAPGLPLPVAGCYLLGDSFLLPHLLVMVFALANSVLYWVIARRYLSPLLAFVGLLMMVCSPVHDQLASIVMSEQMTIFFVLLSMWAFLRCSDTGYRLNGWALLTVAALGYGLLVRGLLLPMLPAMWLFACFDRGSGTTVRGRVLRATVILALGVAPWFAWEARNMTVTAVGFDGRRQTDYIFRHGDPSEPVLPARELAAVMFNNFKWYVPERLLDSFAGLGWFVARQLEVSIPRWVSALVLLGIGLCLLQGLRDFRRGGLPALFFLCSLPLLLIFLEGGNPRYWVQLTPLIMLLVLQALSAINWEKLSPILASRPLGGAVTAAACLFAVSMLVLDHVRRVPQHALAWQGFVDICKESRQVTPEDAVLLSHNILASRLMAARPTELESRDWEAIQGRDVPHRREVFVILAKQKAVAEHGRTGPRSEPRLAQWVGTFKPGRRTEPERPEDYPGTPVEVASNEYYTIYRLDPARP